MAGFLEELRNELIANGVGSMTTIFSRPSADIPSGAGPFWLLSETGGIGPVYVQNQPEPAYVRPSAQVMTVAATAANARLAIQQAYNALAKVNNKLLGATWYLQLRPDQEPFDFPLDAAGRPRCVFNITAWKRPSA